MYDEAGMRRKKIYDVDGNGLAIRQVCYSILAPMSPDKIYPYFI